jgi:arsenite methyltransferase
VPFVRFRVAPRSSARHARLVINRSLGRYGIDAPYVPATMAGVGIALLAVAVVVLATAGTGPEWARYLVVWALVVGVFSLLSCASYLHTTLRGKFLAWSDVLDELGLRGAEHVLDMGPGRGAVLLLAAKRLRTGRAVGVDLWRTVDQSGNSPATTEANARAEGVADRVELRTGDMTAMPVADGEFDVVVSSLAIHNIPSAEGRAAAVDEAVRALRPGGRLALVDFRHVDDYARRLAELGVTGLRTRRLGWRFWYGGPWGGAKLVTGTKPSRPA